MLPFIVEILPVILNSLKNAVTSTTYIENFVGKGVVSMLSTATDIVGRADQAFVVGKGLSNAGVELLGQKLANMTIGDIKAMLDLKNMDPLVVAKLIGQIKDLAIALVSI